MLNEAMDAAVLVKGWKKGANWSFPRGKINKDEDDLICAIREVYEETGYDLDAAGLVPSDRQVKHIEVNMHEQQMRLYVFRNVPMDTYFEPRTRKEISKIQWWKLSELPAFKRKNQQDQPDASSNVNKFYMVAPFLVPLRKWVADQKKRDSRKTHSNQYPSTAIMSHDDMMIEEDRAEESSTQAPSYVSSHEANSLEKATEALSRLLKIQPPTQGLQSDVTSLVPASNNSGQALLALLQSKPAVPTLPPVFNFASQTPPSHSVHRPLVSDPSHHQHPQVPESSSIQNPATFHVEPATNTLLYQNQSHERYHDTEEATRQHQSRLQSQYSHATEHRHPHQSQNLVHPQSGCK